MPLCHVRGYIVAVIVDVDKSPVDNGYTLEEVREDLAGDARQPRFFGLKKAVLAWPCLPYVMAVLERHVCLENNVHL